MSDFTFNGKLDYSPSIMNYRDENSIQVVQSTPKREIRITFSAGTIVLIIVMLIKAFNISTDEYEDRQNHRAPELVIESDSVQVEEVYTKPDSEPIQRNGYMGAFESTGEVFPDSSERYLTDDEIASLGGTNQPLKLQLIQYSINEVYARNGYAFQEKVWRDYYCQFSWYQDKGLDDVETRKRFNAVERENVGKMKRIRDSLSKQ